MTKKIRLIVIAPTRLLCKQEVEWALFPGTKGLFAVYPWHAPLVSSLQAGDLEYYNAGVKKRIRVTGGFVEVRSDGITACVELPGEAPATSAGEAATTGKSVASSAREADATGGDSQ